MKYLIIPGFLAGIALNLFVATKISGSEIVASWTRTVSEIQKQETSAARMKSQGPHFVVRKEPLIYLLDTAGNLAGTADHTGYLAEANRAGNYLIKFQKVGKEIELFDYSGERFWMVESREYPYFSFNGKLVLLMNGDHSRIRIFDYNGNNIGAEAVSGRLCTVIAFSDCTDIGAAGFADGSYVVIGSGGGIIHSGRAPKGAVVKSIAVSRKGLFVAVHYGADDRDGLMIAGVVEGDVSHAAFGYHAARAPLHVSDEGYVMALDRDRIVLIDRKGDEEYSIPVAPAREGQASVVSSGDFYAVAYPGEKGSAALVIVRRDGTVVFSRQFLNEPYLTAEFRGECLLARGSENLYCYSVRSRDPQ
ncbi:MAG TPA: hypothetical protein PK573_15960 [Spirochaetota bacterium]|nr:hypothetical protein [Spirochaetota bacterium]HRZ25450.1 hypothetical protein [Spirochaetota bacterium]